MKTIVALFICLILVVSTVLAFAEDKPAGNKPAPTFIKKIEVQGRSCELVEFGGVLYVREEVKKEPAPEPNPAPKSKLITDDLNETRFKNFLHGCATSLLESGVIKRGNTWRYILLKDKNGFPAALQLEGFVK